MTSAAKLLDRASYSSARYLNESAHHIDLKSKGEVQHKLTEVHNSLIGSGYQLYTRRVTEAHVPNTKIEEHRRYSHRSLGSTLVHGVWNGKTGSVKISSGRD